MSIIIHFWMAFFCKILVCIGMLNDWIPIGECHSLSMGILNYDIMFSC